MALDLPEDLQTVELLSQTLLQPEEDELDKILSQLPAVESFEQYFPHSATSEDATKMVDRFREPVSKEEVKATQKAAVPKNTQKNTNWAVTVWKECSKSRWTRFPSAPAECPAHLYVLAFSPLQLDYWLTRFVLEARRKDGKPYPPNTLHQLVCGILRYVRELKPTIDKDKEFASLRRTLDAEMKSLRAQGLGTTPKQAQPITPADEEKLWASHVL